MKPKQMTQQMERTHPFFVILKNRNFRLFWIGEALSVLGSQFYLIALPWLVLKLTGDPFQMGTVLALAGIPRALFMLVGGAFTDRYSARTLMIASNSVRMAIGLLLAILVLNSWATLALLYSLSLAFGLADAFLFPAQSAMVPHILNQNHLLAGNALVQGTAQLSIAVGPAIAGLTIAYFSTHTNVPFSDQQTVDLFGVAVAFVLNASAFLLSIIMFLLIKLDSPAFHPTPKRSARVYDLLKEGIVYVKGDRTLVYLLFVAAINHFLVEGPLLIGIPVLANSRFVEGAAAFGIIMSGLGAGMMLGIILAGVLPKLKPAIMGQTLIALLSLAGLGLMIPGLLFNTYVVALTVMAMGLAQGYAVVQFSTWMQIRTPSHLLGRTLGMMMFASVGLVPVSQALCGALIKLSVTGLFIGAGVILTIANLIVWFKPEIKAMGLTSTPVKKLDH